MSDSQIVTATRDWFRDQGVLDDYVGAWSLDDITVNGDYIDLAITSWYSTWVKPCDAPDISVMVATVVADASNVGEKTYIPKDPTVVYRVPLLIVDEIVILDTKALNRIIEPAIQKVNGWERWNIGMNIYHMFEDWDSWFLNRQEQFKYNGGIYTVGHRSITWSEGMLSVIVVSHTTR